MGEEQEGTMEMEKGLRVVGTPIVCPGPWVCCGQSTGDLLVVGEASCAGMLYWVCNPASACLATITIYQKDTGSSVSLPQTLATRAACP